MRKSSTDKNPPEVAKNVEAQEQKPQEQTVLPPISQSQTIDPKLAQTSPDFKTKQLLSKTITSKIFERNMNFTQYKMRMRSKSPKEKKIIPTTRRGNGIPPTLLQRLEYFGKIFRKESFLKYYKNAPPRGKSTLEQITKYITKYTGPKGELDTIAMIFYYICNQINYDVKGLENHRDLPYYQKPEYVISTGLALSEGFNKLFEYMCRKKNIRTKQLFGNSKFFPTGEKDFNHQWSAVFFKNEWYFVDTLFGSGGPFEKNEFQPQITYFNPYYFFTPPEYLILTHRPTDDDWQMTPKTTTIEQFNRKFFFDFGRFYQKVYEYEVKLLSYDFPIVIISSKNMVINLKIKDCVIQSDLYHANGKDKIGEVKFSHEEDKNFFSLEPSFPGNGDYIVRTLVRRNTSTDLIYSQLVDYLVKVRSESQFRFNRFKIKRSQNKLRNSTANPSLPKLKNFDYIQPKIISDYNKVFPSKTSKRICFDNEGAHLIEPKRLALKVGAEVRFKVRVKGVSAVGVLDGKKMTYLRRIDEDIYEGVIVVQNETLSICSLKPCNVFTEVFQFKASNKDKVINRRVMFK